MPRALLATTLYFALASPAWAEPAPTAEQLRDWVKDLDSSSYKTRDQAARRLRQAGPDAAPVLAKAARSGTTEVADRALRILGEMAECNDAKTETAARRQLRRLADSEAGIANEARSILNRRRNLMLTVLLFAGATCREEDGKVTSVRLDNVTDLQGVLPLLSHFPEIEYVSLSNKRFNDTMAPHLAELPNLQYLNLFESNIGDDGLKHLTGLKNLRNIPMGHTRVTDKGLEIISGMTQLEYVGVRGNNVTDAGLVHLKGLTNLTGLYLGETKVTDEGLKRLAPLTKLQMLYLHNTVITDAGLEHLKDHKELRGVFLGKTRTTEAGRERLKEAIPELKILDGSDR
jgi:Leucine Rich repeat